MPILYIVATPIGNLEDITLRALRTLREVDVILCEDTRKTRQLLQHYEINKQLLSYHQQSSYGKIQEIAELFNKGRNLAFVTDSGSPGISDPGNYLISQLLVLCPALSIVPIPGASAVISLASVSGCCTDQFLFLGFLPHKKGKLSTIEKIKDSKIPVVFYESPHRIMKTLEVLANILEPERKMVIGREMTKMHETILRGTASELREKMKTTVCKGEFAVIVNGANKKEQRS